MFGERGRGMAHSGWKDTDIWTKDCRVLKIPFVVVSILLLLFIFYVFIRKFIRKYRGFNDNNLKSHDSPARFCQKKRKKCGWLHVLPLIHVEVHGVVEELSNVLSRLCCRGWAYLPGWIMWCTERSCSYNSPCSQKQTTDKDTTSGNRKTHCNSSNPMPLFMYLLYHAETSNMKETMQADAAIGLFLSAVIYH